MDIYSCHVWPRERDIHNRDVYFTKSEPDGAGHHQAWRGDGIHETTASRIKVVYMSSQWEVSQGQRVSVVAAVRRLVTAAPLLAWGL